MMWPLKNVLKRFLAGHLSEPFDHRREKQLLLKYPDMKCAYVIELKYINRSQDTPQLREEKLKKARAQLNPYAQTPQVTQTIGPTTLKKVILLFFGWELVVQEELG